MKTGIALPIKIQMNSETKELLKLSKESFEIVFAPLTNAQQKELEKTEEQAKKIYTQEIKDLELEIDEAEEDLGYYSEKLDNSNTKENIESKRKAQLLLRQLKKDYKKFDIDKINGQMTDFKNVAIVKMLESCVTGKDRENILKIANDFANGGELVLEFLLSAYQKEREELKNG